MYEVTLTGLGSSEIRSNVLPLEGGLPGAALSPAGSVALELVSSGTFTEGARGAGGQRYVTAGYRVRNATGRSLNNVTLLLVARSSAIPGTPFSSLVRFDGTAADPSIAGAIAPTGAVAPRGEMDGLRALHPDVLQVFTEAEVAALARPAGVLDVFPVGFVVRPATAEATSRTLPPAASANQYDGVVTFSFRVPLQASASADVYSLAFQVLAIEDTETRMTESIEEGQDTSAVRLLRERAALLGATTVTVLAGSPASGPDVADYPGQRHVCSVRTAGTAAAPAGFITRPGAYTRLALYRPGERVSACDADFRAGTAAAPALNTPYPITLRAMDRYGNVLPGAVDTVALSPSGPAATVGAAAPLVTGEAGIPVVYQAVGTSVLTGTGRRTRARRSLVVPAVATIALYGGGNQAAMAGTTVPVAPSVVVRDLGGAPLAGVPVTFAVTGGGGAVTGAVALTNASGVAALGSWVLGAQATINALSATTPGAAGAVAFQASGCAGGGGTGYAMTLCYGSPLTPAQRAAFEDAAARWRGVVTGDVPDFAMSFGAGTCGAGTPGFSLAADDLVILARVEDVDGAGGLLGAAGPCINRSAGALPIVARLRLDAADMAYMETNGLLRNVILHEMGHALGIGTRWSAFLLLRDPSTPDGAPADTYFAGANAMRGFDLVGGTAYTGGQKVPVENAGALGTINVHWREEVLGDELMTGWASLTAMPLSQVTVRSLADMGYAVDPAAADPFSLDLLLRAEPGRRIPLGDDVDAGPQYTLGSDGALRLPP
ncbi:leishmanolysin-related zinc metalloendopeptidase [Longimicrobium sp.]|uniref:leishmanolysin-related zinc metalloendopeptidase n=1 Tax=Longimicrobium sp. TaxID=2029185 RepID=UPI002E3669B7|nr:leishmanolysin-related zinc metalloendopeptidase [Longimicrobium sp.]HEX6040485.1 leishmanolysin-related zinc metalloendopeptidase [Longimicrobium sp.]